MTIEDNNIIFENDDEFYEWGIIPNLIVRNDDNGLYTDFEFSPL